MLMGLVRYLLIYYIGVTNKRLLSGIQRRGWGQTLMELISPLLMMSLVVWGWSKSKEDQFALEFPVNSTIPLFQVLKNEYGSAQSLLQLCPPDRLLSQVSRIANITFLINSTIKY